MAAFSYIARDRSGKRVSGTLAGVSEQAVLGELAARDLSPVKVSPVKEQSSGGALGGRISTRRLATMYRQLADLLRAGVPLLRALRLLGRTSPKERSAARKRMAGVLSDVADQVADGARLADAMATHEKTFPPVQIAMVRAGERGGFIEDVLARMSHFLEKQADTRGKIVGNLIYPVLLLAIGTGIVAFALLFFVPKFESFYARMELPLPTKILLGASNALQSYWLLLLIAIGVVIAGGMWAWRQREVRRRIAQIQLRIPKLGPLVQSIAVARFARILGTLLENGIPMLSAMQISRDAAGHILLEEAIDDATEAVRAGESLATPLGESGMFDPESIEIIAVGEEANNLPAVLMTMADTIENRIDRMLSVFLRLIEPLLLLLMAGAVLFIFVALIVPMMRLSSGL